MKYNQFIKDAPKISEIGLGTWQLGVDKSWENMSDSEAEKLILKSFDLGINFFDTAPNYGYGTSEERLGKTLKNIDRSKIVINTKFGHTDKGTTNFESKYIRESLERSLKRLRTDYLDSIIIHNPPKKYLDGNSTDHYEILDKLKEEGKIREYGASIDTFEEMDLLMQTTNSKVIEAFFNILHQDTARAFNLAKEKEVGIIVKIPLDSGWLSGRYNAQSRFNDIRNRWSVKEIETRAHLVDKIKNILPKPNEIVQSSISFCLSYDAVSTVIPGNKNIQQLIENYEGSKKPLPKEIITQLEDFYKREVESLKLPW